MNTRLIIAAIPAAVLLAGCASTAGSASGGPSSSAASDVAAANAAAASASAAAASAAAAPCTTHACIASDVEQSLSGLVAKDEAVITKAACKSSTVKQPASGTYTVTCTATYSDGSVARGIASLLTAQDKVAWEPTDIISDDSGS